MYSTVEEEIGGRDCCVIVGAHICLVITTELHIKINVSWLCNTCEDTLTGYSFFPSSSQYSSGLGRIFNCRSSFDHQMATNRTDDLIPTSYRTWLYIYKEAAISESCLMTESFLMPAGWTYHKRLRRRYPVWSGVMRLTEDLLSGGRRWRCLVDAEQQQPPHHPIRPSTASTWVNMAAEHHTLYRHWDTKKTKQVNN